MQIVPLELKVGKKGMVPKAHGTSRGNISAMRKMRKLEAETETHEEQRQAKRIQLGSFEGEGTRQKHGLSAHIGGGSEVQ